PIIERIKHPKAKIQTGTLLSKNKGVTACIDSSDGLAISLWELAEQSSCKIVIDYPPLAQEILPYCEEYDISWQKCVFEGGEEFELVFTVKKDDFELLQSLLLNQNMNIIPIGTVQKGKGVYFESKPILREGWDAGLGDWTS
ncbi:MAG: thiamine-monophosphate kinase, partial [Candidatus Hodarchaeota archaeon]